VARSHAVIDAPAVAHELAAIEASARRTACRPWRIGEGRGRREGGDEQDDQSLERGAAPSPKTSQQDLERDCHADLQRFPARKLSRFSPGAQKVASRLHHGQGRTKSRECMMKADLRVDPVPGKETVVFSCFNQDQPRD
jgi:hypothetical protein